MLQHLRIVHVQRKNFLVNVCIEVVQPGLKTFTCKTDHLRLDPIMDPTMINNPRG